MDSVSHFGARTAGQASDDSALATFFRQAKPTGERGATGFRWLARFGFRTRAYTDSPPGHHGAPGEAHDYR